MEFYDETKMGYKITNRGTYYNELKKDNMAYFIIAYRPFLKDYVIGLNYNFYEGTWGNGVYDFKSQKTAQDWLLQNKKLVTFY